eukprot:COSAG01_NODE_4084_length_5372_cov_6.319932_4_plen_43_part_00
MCAVGVHSLAHSSEYLILLVVAIGIAEPSATHGAPHTVLLGL